MIASACGTECGAGGGRRARSGLADDGLVYDGLGYDGLGYDGPGKRAARRRRPVGSHDRGATFGGNRAGFGVHRRRLDRPGRGARLGCGAAAARFRRRRGGDAGGSRNRGGANARRDWRGRSRRAILDLLHETVCGRGGLGDDLRHGGDRRRRNALLHGPLNGVDDRLDGRGSPAPGYRRRGGRCAVLDLPHDLAGGIRGSRDHLRHGGDRRRRNALLHGPLNRVDDRLDGCHGRLGRLGHGGGKRRPGAL